VTDAVIDNPILNGPYDPPTRHSRFDDSGITEEVVEGRRTSGYFVPVPQARQQSAGRTSSAHVDGWPLPRGGHPAFGGLVSGRAGGSTDK